MRRRRLLRRVDDGLRLECLERRELLAGDPIKINFQTTDSVNSDQHPELIGYLADDGDAFGSRGDALRYGWLDGDLNPDSQRETRNRNNNSAPDERYDTLNHMIKGDQHSWQIELDNGTYQLHVVAGDPSHTDQVNDIRVISGGESILLDDPDNQDNWDEYTVEEFTVTSGMLRLSPASSGTNQKLAYLEITPLSAPEVPAIGTPSISNSQSFRAEVSGAVLDDGNEPPEVSVFFGTSDGGLDPTAWQHQFDLGVQTDSFAAELTQLEAGTDYFVRFRATNSAGAAWSPSSTTFRTLELTRATIVSHAATDIGAREATVMGQVESIGSDIPDVTLYWGTSDGGTGPGNWENAVPLGPQDATVTTTLTDLPAATTIFYRHAATNMAGTRWSVATESLTTLTISTPVVETVSAESVEAFTADLLGRVVATGNEVPTVTVYWGTEDGGEEPVDWQHAAEVGQQPGAFSWTVDNLTFNTTYHFRARAENSAGVDWSPVAQAFTTLNVTPAILQNDPATEVGSTTASIGGRVTDAGNDTPDVRLFYGATDGGTDANAWDAAVDFSDEFGSFQTNLTGLQPETTYYYRAMATNAAGTRWAGSSAVFTTQAAPTLLITELMARNQQTLTTRLRASVGAPLGELLTPDWIEIFNPTDQTVVLSGLHLTDDPEDRTKWVFPPGSDLGPNQYLVVFASGENIADPRLDERGYLHTNFQLSSNGEFLAITATDGTVLHAYDPGYPNQRADISYGLDSASVQHFYGTPSPGESNIPSDVHQVADTTFSHDRGFYDEPFTLTVRSETPGATIVYTQDGSQPSLNHGTQVPAASADQIPEATILITGTTTVRAAAFKDGFDPTNVDTQTYLFLDQVLQQSETFGIDGSGLPEYTTWGSSGPDWEVDPEIVNHSDPDNRLTTDDLRSVPSLSLVLPWEDMFVSGPGIYISGTGSPRAVSVEQILPDGDTGFQIGASVQIQGGSSTNRWKADKLSMRLKFTEQFGPTKLENPIFGPDATDRLDTIILDAVLNFGFHHPSTGQTGNAKFIQDQFVANLQNAMGGVAPHARYHHLYINGLYWGMYYVHERPDASFAAQYLGGDKDDYDVLKHRSRTAVDGTTRNYRDMLDLSREDLSLDINYRALAQQLDMVQFVDYMLLNFYVGNTDWAHQNWYASYNRESGDGKWRFHSWDAEHVLKSVNEDVTNKDNSGGPTEIHQRLRANAEYRQLFADRVQLHLFDDGVLTPDHAAAEYQALMDEIDRAIVGESARWGDNRVRSPYTRDDWLGTQTDLLDNYFPRRTDQVIRQLRNDGLFTPTELPTPNFAVDGQTHTGGSTPNGAQLEIEADGGTIYFTLDGSDPRQAGGGVADSAIDYSQGLIIDDAMHVAARVQAADGQWSALRRAAFYPHPLADAGNLAITEINYNPHESLSQFGEINIDSDEYEFIEVANVSDETIQLVDAAFAQQKIGDHLEGISFRFPETKLDAGQRVVIVKNTDAFIARYGDDATIVGEYQGQLDDGGEQLWLQDAAGETIEQFEYEDNRRWGSRADALGSSLERIDPQADPSDPASWQDSIDFGGSPSAPPSVGAPGVTINEVLTHTDEPQIDLIELFNQTDAAIDISNWYVSDSRADLFAFRVPGNTVIPANGYTVFDENQLGFGFKGQSSDDAWLVSADPTGKPLQFVDRVQFGAAENGVSLGRWPNGSGELFPMTANTFGADNSAPLQTGIVISEVHYHAAEPGPNAGIVADQLEFVEVWNGANQAVDLSHWRLSEAIDYTFPNGTHLPSGTGVVVVSFDATANPSLATAFRLTHAMPPTAQLLGPYDRVLDNGGETLTLVRPEDAVQWQTGQVLVDRVTYDDQAPWPVTADGQGDSLQRLAVSAFGDFIASWQGQRPNPGRAAFDQVLGDLTDDGLVDIDDINELCRRIGLADLPADLNNDSTTDTDDLEFLVHDVIDTHFGDADLNGVFDSSDLILVFAAGLYEDRVDDNASWSTGDWNCDGEFDSTDMVVAFQDGGYRR